MTSYFKSIDKGTLFISYTPEINATLYCIILKIAFAHLCQKPPVPQALGSSFWTLNILKMFPSGGKLIAFFS